MLKGHRILLTCVCGLLLGFSSTSMARSRTLAPPHRYQPASADQQLVQTTNPVDGRTWAAWAFRSGAQYDIALSFLEDGRWSEPAFQGRDDGLDQVDPVLAVHESGVLVVAFAEPTRGRILLSVLPPGSSSFRQPVPVASGDDLRSPSLLFLGNRLVLAYRSGEHVRLVELQFRGESPAGTYGFTDGPDTTGIGADEDRDDSDDDKDDEDRSSKGGMVPVIDDAVER